ncbi:HNH endonuclease [Burkholderia ubonensis]|uniref:HNH endonuclease n=2 Tax=Burkholderia ubonensis TaxID=101571 RepID=UPI0012F9A91E|nr:hypothetical protein [Burkholderia ubonensis]
MGSKKYRGKTSVHCGRDRAANTGDHVIAREFCLSDSRENLHKVPACTSCNNAKSQLEHYVLAVLPMGGAHPDAAATIKMQLAPRLAKNDALRRRIDAGGKKACRSRLKDRNSQISRATSRRASRGTTAVADCAMFSGEGLRLFEDAMTNMDAGGRAQGVFRNGGVRLSRRVHQHEQESDDVADVVFRRRRTWRADQARRNLSQRVCRYE